MDIIESKRKLVESNSPENALKPHFIPIKTLGQIKEEESRERLAITDKLVDQICGLYGDMYDDREEDSSIGGENWLPGQKAGHKSLAEFRRELKTYGIDLSTTKIRKILITGGVYSSATSREIEELYEELGSIEEVAKRLGVTVATVSTYLPYRKTAYKLENKTANAKRIDRWRAKHK